MSEQPQRQRPNRNSDLARYAGLGMQIFVSLGIAAYLGFKADQWLDLAIPLLVWALPLAVVSLMIYKLVKETTKRK